MDKNDCYEFSTKGKCCAFIVFKMYIFFDTFLKSNMQEIYKYVQIVFIKNFNSSGNKNKIHIFKATDMSIDKFSKDSNKLNLTCSLPGNYGICM